MRKPRVKCLLPGRRTALTVCQAMSIAMTVVLPAPVASFSARRSSCGFASALAVLRLLEQALARREMRRDLGQPDRGLDRFDLAEERADAAELVMPPVLEQSRRLRRHLPLAGRQVAPRVDLAADLVDDRTSGRTAASSSRGPAPRRRPVLPAWRFPAASSASGSGVMNSARRRRSMQVPGRLARSRRAPSAGAGTRTGS